MRHHACTRLRTHLDSIQTAQREPKPCLTVVSAVLISIYSDKPCLTQTKEQKDNEPCLTRKLARLWIASKCMDVEKLHVFTTPFVQIASELANGSHRQSSSWLEPAPFVCILLLQLLLFGQFCAQTRKLLAARNPSGVSMCCIQLGRCPSCLCSVKVNGGRRTAGSDISDNELGR